MIKSYTTYLNHIEILYDISDTYNSDKSELVIVDVNNLEHLVPMHILGITSLN